MAKILVVDDTYITRNAITMVFKLEGHEVTACSTLDTAQEAMQKSKFDGLITDAHYPGQKHAESGGDELLAWVRAMPETTRPKVLITSVDEGSARGLAVKYADLKPQSCVKGNCLRYADFVAG